MKQPYDIAPTVKTRKRPEFTVDFRKIKSESGIPIPEDADVLGRQSNGTRSLYPIAGMKIGDSFSFPHDPSKERRQWTSVHAALRMYQKNVDPKAAFVVRIIRKEGVIRCWRIKASAAR